MCVTFLQSVPCCHQQNIWPGISAQVMPFMSGNRKSCPSLKTETLSPFCYLYWSWFWVQVKDGTVAERRVGLLAGETCCSRLCQESGVSAKNSWIERELKSQTRKKKCVPVFPVNVYPEPAKLEDGLRKHLPHKLYEEPNHQIILPAIIYGPRTRIVLCLFSVICACTASQNYPCLTHWSSPHPQVSICLVLCKNVCIISDFSGKVKSHTFFCGSLGHHTLCQLQ